MLITDSQEAAFQREGYCVVDGGLSSELLEMFRAEADESIVEIETAIERNDPDVENLNRVPEHLFIPGQGDKLKGPSEFLFGGLMAEACRRFLGQSAYLFIELFVCKTPRSKAEFEWHQDTGYIHNFGYRDYPPNLSVWLALDDMDESNGALWVLPFSQWPDRVVVPHEETEQGSLRGCFAGDFKGVPLRMEAGSVVFFSGLLPHRSGPNLTDRYRRAYLWQYSPYPILDNGKPIQRAVPFLKDGKSVFQGWSL